MAILARRSLFWKYTAWCAALVSVLLVLSGGLGGWFAYQQALAASDALQREKARYVATEIGNVVARLEEALQSTARKFGSEGPVDVEDLQVELIALLRHEPSIMELHWIDAGGRETYALARVARDDAARARDWAEDPRFAATRTRAVYTGPVYFRSETEPYLSIANRRAPGGNLLVAEVSLKFVSDAITRMRLAPSELAYVVDREGRLISHADIGLVLGRADLAALPQVRRALDGGAPAIALGDDARNLDGHAVVATAVPIERLGWTVVAEQTRAEALRPVYESIARSVALVLLGVLAAIVGSVIFARRMVRPIRQIEAGARAIGAGHLDQRIEVRTGDELEALATGFNRMAEQLQAIYATQETRIAERTRDLALANEAKSRFLAAASHDLRQPMHALSLFVGQLRSAPDSPQAPLTLQKIERSVEALEQLLEALLDLSKLDMGAVAAQKRPFALQELLARLAAQLAPVAEAKGLALTLVPTSLWVASDPLLLERILTNVIGNAIRYTREGRVLIGCRRRGGDVEVTVADTGVGIAREHLPNIFREFYQVAPQGAPTKGLGLGLAIVRRLATLLGHEVSVASAPGKGTVVRVRAPRALPQAATPEAAPDAVRGLDGTRVLLVDDDDAVRDALGGLLAQWGCAVIAARGGEEALALTANARPDVVLCDLALAAGESGLDVAARLAQRHGDALPLAFVTGEAAPATIDAVRARGYPIVFKPAKPARIRALIEHLLAAG